MFACKYDRAKTRRILCHNIDVNTQDDIEKLDQAASGFLGYFDQQVLASYRNEPHKFDLEADSFEGTLTLTQTYYRELEEAGNTDEWLNLKFGYRTLADGNLAIALWLPDLMKAKAHQAKWRGFRLENPYWTDPDERFQQWITRYIGGSWEVDNGPKFYLAETVSAINGFTIEIVGYALYEFPIDSSLTFPAGENTHRYEDAHGRLYGFLVDGLNKKCIQALATKVGTQGNFDNKNTLDALKRVFPELAAPSKFDASMSLVSEQRRQAHHSVRPPAMGMAAFSTFTQDLTLCLAGVREVFECLENHLGVDGMSASKKNEARKQLPNIRETQHRFAFIHEATKIEGKTIEEWSTVT
jgi:hypothetical protein